ncbi:MAG: archaeal flagellin FlaB [Archaeoglobaceae archaeon]|nr:archaeal flagellin FlaB [Archaeoglobaceae archaeon]
MRRFVKNEKAFTGLEAAIVLIAFVTVAAVFSYVLLGAGFFATQKGQETVHTGVKQATSSMELVGSIVAEGDTDNNKLTGVTFTLQLAAGGQPIDLNKTLITVVNPKDGLRTSFVASGNDNWIYSIQGSTPDDYLEEFEKAEITLDLSSLDLDPNEDFVIEIKPPQGATYPIELKVPPSIDNIMVLLK